MAGFARGLGGALRGLGKALDGLGGVLQGSGAYRETRECPPAAAAKHGDPAAAASAAACAARRATACDGATLLRSSPPLPPPHASVNKAQSVQAFGGKRPVLGSDVFVAPSASVIGDVQLGSGASVWYGAVVRGGCWGGAYVGAGNVVDGWGYLASKDRCGRSVLRTLFRSVLRPPPLVLPAPPAPPPFPPAGDVNSVVVGEKSSIQDNAIVHVARHNPAGKVRRPWELRRGAATMIAVMLPAARAGAPPRLLLICCPSHFRILSAVSRAAAALPRPAPPRPLQKLPTLIGSNVTIGQGAIIHGATIQDCVVVGMGATVMDGVTVRAPPACVEVTAAPHSVHMPPQLPGDMELCDACCDPDVQACCLSLTTLVLTLGVQPVPALCAGREPVGGGRGRAGAPGHAHPQRPGLGGQPRQVPAQPRGRWVPGVGGCRGWVPGVGAGGVGEPG